MQDETARIKKASQVSSVIWMAMCISLLPYLAFGVLLVPEGQQPPEGLALIEQVLSAFSAVCVIASLVVPKKLISSQLIKSQGEDLTGFMIKRHRVALIVGLALGESVGLFGLVLRFMGSAPIAFYGFIAVSAIALLRLRPSEKALTESVEAAKQEEKHARP